MNLAMQNIVIIPVKDIQNKSKETFQNDQDQDRSSDKNNQHQWINLDKQNEYSQKISNNLFVRVDCIDSTLKRKNYR